MFANIGWGEMVVLVVVGLVVLGPERLPGAIRWSTNALRQARDYLSNATGSLREEMGPEFAEFDRLREPLSELQKLRGMSPREAVTKHLLDGDDSVFTGRFDNAKSDGPKPAPPSVPRPTMPPPGSPPPFDTDAT